MKKLNGIILVLVIGMTASVSDGTKRRFGNCDL